MYKTYRKSGLTQMRPYVSGEDLTRISVSAADKELPTLDGGMIAHNSGNPDDQWYVAKAYFEKNYEEVI